MDDATAPKIEYGVTPTEVMAAMAGIDFVRAVFDGRLPAPPIMQSIEPFDSTAEPGVVVIHSTLPAGTGYTTLEFKVSFIRGMTENTGPVRTEGRILNVGRRAATAEARITDTNGSLLAHATTTCLVFEIPKV